MRSPSIASAASRARSDILVESAFGFGLALAVALLVLLF